MAFTRIPSGDRPDDHGLPRGRSRPSVKFCSRLGRGPSPILSLRQPGPQRGTWIGRVRVMRTNPRSLLLAAAFAGLAFTGAARAAQIVVSNYGVAANGMPYAVAMEKGFFKQEGADVSGILSSIGGGTTIRNLLGGNLDYGEVDLAGTVAAIEQGNDLHIVSDNVLTVGEFVW